MIVDNLLSRQKLDNNKIVIFNVEFYEETPENKPINHYFTSGAYSPSSEHNFDRENYSKLCNIVLE